MIIHVADDHFGNIAVLPGQLGLPGLIHEIFRKRGPGGQRFEHELPALLILGRIVAGDVAGGKVVAPILICLDQLFKFSLKVVRRLLGINIFFRVAVKFDIVGRLGEIGCGRHFTSFTGIGIGVFFALFSLLLGDFFQNRILLELLFHQGLELQGRGLQQSQ